MRVLIAVPAMESVATEFYQSCLSLKHDGSPVWAVTRSSLIYDARNALAKKAVEEGYDRVLWLDSDMVFQPDLLERLSADMDEGRDYVCGLYFKRKIPYVPVIYKEMSVSQNESGMLTPRAITFDDYPKNEVFEVVGSGFGAVMTSVDLLRRAHESFGQPFTPVVGFGEDLSFCLRVQKLGVKMFCDSRIKVGHIGSVLITEGSVDGQSIKESPSD